MSIKDYSRYRDLKVMPGEYVPDAGYTYSDDDPMFRMVPSPQVRTVAFDDTYPYLDDSFKFKFNRFIAYTFLVNGVLLLMAKVKYGLKFEGRDILKKYKKEFKGGIISVSNHCFRFDGSCIAQALRHRLWIPMLSDLMTSDQWWKLVHFGGIPLSDGSLSAQKKFNEAFDTIHSRGGWIHVFPEARSWWYYKPLRPWMKGFFTMAYKWNCPVLPMAITYRERKGIYRLFDKPEVPLITVRIGEPIFPDMNAPRKDEVERLLRDSHAAVCKLAGITHNTWPASLTDK